MRLKTFSSFNYIEVIWVILFIYLFVRKQQQQQQQQQLDKGDFSCSSPSGLDCREPYELQLGELSCCVLNLSGIMIFQIYVIDIDGGNRLGPTDICADVVTFMS